MLGVWSRAIAAPASAGAVFFVPTVISESGAIPELRWFCRRAAALTYVEDSDTISEVRTEPRRVCS